MDADLLELKPVKELNPDKGTKFMWGGAQSTMKKKPKLETFEIDPLDYDLVIIGTPVWAWNYTPPVRTFLSKFDLTDKKVALWTCSAGTGNRAMNQFKKALKNSKVIGYNQFQFAFKEPLEQELTEYSIRTKAWALELLDNI